MYIPLRIHSPFSVGFGMVRTEDVVAHCRRNAIPAAGFTDRNSLAGAMTLSQKLVKAGIQPIVGTTLSVTEGGLDGTLVLFAASAAGFGRLLRIVNARNLDSAAAPLTLNEIVRLSGGAAEGLIALTGGEDGLLTRFCLAGKDAEALGKRLSALFPDALYVEIQRGPDGALAGEADLRRLAGALELPLVATHETHYAEAGMQDAHDAFLCISQKSFLTEADRVHARPDRHLLDVAEIDRRFADMPEAVANSVEIARRIGFCPEASRPRLPVFPDAEPGQEDQLLERNARNGLARRLEASGAAGAQDYAARLDHELAIIARMGFSGYFLIVADFIGWARSQDIPVGPGRGSGAGSLVAWALGITDIDPIRFGLLFERFLNPERVSMPDFDIDFCQARRGEVIDYVRRKYGPDQVAHIAAFGTLQARAVVRDVGRVMQIPYPAVDRLAKMIPHNPSNPVSLARAMEDPGLRSEIERSGSDIGSMFRIALKLEGLYRHVSTHAAGVIISDRPIAESVPVHLDQDGQMTTSYEMKAVEAAGLVKFDFLGLKNLDIIEGTLRFLDESGEARPDFGAIGFKDDDTFAALGRGDGFAVFQLESDGMCRAMAELRVENIEELIALISLYRPGPMEQIGSYADVKRGRKAVSYPHAEMREVLEPTRGVMIYQEQVMEIARRIAGYSLGEADLLRRAMGKKIPAEMDAQRQRFLDGAAEGWIDILLEDGRRIRRHASARAALADGSGRSVSLREAADRSLDIAL